MTCPACPINPNHKINQEPDGMWCEQCRKHYQRDELATIEIEEEWE